MKKTVWFLTLAIAATLFASCSKKDYKTFVGTWGVEKIIYESYNTDYLGNPIQGSMETNTYEYDPEDVDHGIQLIFKKDKSGEMRDNDVDSLPIVNGNDTTYIQCSDTTLVTKFTYSYDEDESILFMNLPSLAITYMLKISDLTDDSFKYENNYGIGSDNRVYIETAYMKRISNKTSKTGTKTSKNTKCHPRMKGSFLGAN